MIYGCLTKCANNFRSYYKVNTHTHTDKEIINILVIIINLKNINQQTIDADSHTSKFEARFQLLLVLDNIQTNPMLADLTYVNAIVLC